MNAIGSARARPPLQSRAQNASIVAARTEGFRVARRASRRRDVLVRHGEGPIGQSRRLHRRGRVEDVEVRASGVDEVRRVILGRVRDGDEFGPRRRVRGYVPDGASNRASRRRALGADVGR